MQNVGVIKMKFSILIPVYNTQKYIDACLKSVLKQTYQDYEIVIYNDVSTDYSLSICEKYRNSFPQKISIFSGVKNIGLCMSRIELVKHAHGDYCIFVDSDDFVSIHLLETIDEALSRDTPDIVMYDMYAHYEFRPCFYYNKRFYYGTHSVIYEKERISKYYQDISTFKIHAMWRKAFRRDMWNRITFDDISKKVQIGEDLYFTLNLMNFTRSVKYIPEALYYYRCNFSSMTHVFTTNRLFDKLRVCEFFLKCIMRRNDLDILRIKSNILQHIAFSTIQYIATMASKSCNLSKTDREQIFIKIAKEPLINLLINDKTSILDETQKIVITGICTNDFSQAEKLIRKSKMRYIIRDTIGNLILK